MKQEQKCAHWASIIEQQKHSQLTIKQFCQDNDIHYQTFFYWSKRLRSSDAVQTLQPIVFEESRDLSHPSVVICFANGIRAELPASLSPAQIKHWLDALQ